MANYFATVVGLATPNTMNTMIEAGADAVERAVWEGIRTLEESVSLSRHIARKNPSLRDRLLKKAETGTSCPGPPQPRSQSTWLT